MDVLTEDCMEQIASSLLDERDIACLRCTCKCWAAILESPQIWSTLVANRFGAEAVPNEAMFAATVYKRLAKLQRPVHDGKVVWLHSQYMQVTEAAGSVADRVVQLNSVCWLELVTTITGVLPGRYQARYRLKFLPQWWTDELRITATPSEGCGQPTSRLYTWQQLRDAVGPAGVWVQLSTGTFTMTSPGSVEVRLDAHSGSWKRDMLFDVAQLVREQGPRGRSWRQHAQQQQQQQQGQGQGQLGRGALDAEPAAGQGLLDAVRQGLQEACHMQ